MGNNLPYTKNPALTDRISVILNSLQAGEESVDASCLAVRQVLATLHQHDLISVAENVYW